jgi:c-di-GMP-binding flagellar brake protein YcgR
MPDDPTRERRSRQRLTAHLPVKLRQPNGPELDATTRDLSSSGIFLYAEKGLEPGTKIELVITVPASLGLGPGGWALCQASVVRVEDHSDQGVGVAASLDRIELLHEL